MSGKLLLDPAMADHPKFEGIPSSAGWLYVSALLYAARNRTDGFIPKARVHKLTNDSTKTVSRAVNWLTETRPGIENALWKTVEGGFEIHDYMDPCFGNPTNEGGRRVHDARVNAGRKGGEVSAQRRREVYGTAQPLSTEAEANPEANMEQSASKQVKQTRSTPSPSPSPSPRDLSLSPTPFPTEAGNGFKDPQPTEPPEYQPLLDWWHEANGGHVSPIDCQDAAGMYEQFRYLSAKDMAELCRQQAEWRASDGLQAFRKLGLYYETIRRANEKRSDDGFSKRDAPGRRARTGGFSQISEVELNEIGAGK